MATNNRFQLDPREIVTCKDSNGNDVSYHRPLGCGSQLWIVPDSVSRTGTGPRESRVMYIAPSAMVTCDVVGETDVSINQEILLPATGCNWIPKHVPRRLIPTKVNPPYESEVSV